eukprot:CAMPEP_0118939066 /NCGR_PEP_ID=MMETSP1169-20130426/27850_1 /TAXON_ID=36882 /ORGANISM="Pyramimonas obovata, Strain CCMP722" /LENGTH=118 /DNA_ID=CAMNT_0006883241 /DNA_START=441 /DNA_END=794 /DNA_ORIENTATION=-
MRPRLTSSVLKPVASYQSGKAARTLFLRRRLDNPFDSRSSPVWRAPQIARAKKCRPARRQFAVWSSMSSAEPAPERDNSVSPAVEPSLPSPAQPRPDDKLPSLLTRPYHEAVWVVAWP